jgi:hypothetical protein
VFDKITSPDFFCYNASIIQKNCTDVFGKIYVGAVFLRRTVFYCICTFIEAKAELFLLHGSNFRDFSAKCFCFIHIIFLLQRTVFCCIGTFIKTKAGLRKFRETRVSLERRLVLSYTYLYVVVWLTLSLTFTVVVVLVGGEPWHAHSNDRMRLRLGKRS